MESGETNLEKSVSHEAAGADVQAIVRGTGGRTYLFASASGGASRASAGDVEQG